MLINVARELCIGAAPCVAIAGDVFQLDEEGKAIVVGTSTDETNIRLAAESCPVLAIYLYDEKKNQVFPPVADGKQRPYVETTPANDNATTAGKNTSNDNAITPEPAPSTASKAA